MKKQSNGPRKLQDLSGSSSINWDKYKTKGYIHFDKQVSIEHMKQNLQNPEWVASHAFLPFIHYEQKHKKYILVRNDSDKKAIHKKKKKKIRKIYYAAHKDSLIYKYYGDILNDHYNSYVIDAEIDENVIAYRNNKKGKSTIDYAYEVFDFLYQYENALIITTDFSNFFDKIVHSTLKKHIKTVLKVDTLPEDWFRIYRNITKYHYVEKIDLEEYLLNKYGKKQLKKIRRNLKQYMTPQELRNFKDKIKPNSLQGVGIPQGSGISAVCANIHLIEFDKEIAEWSKGSFEESIYRRYSDDIILIIPLNNMRVEAIDNIINTFFTIIESYSKDGLEVQKDKSQIRIKKGNMIFDYNYKPSVIDYLGFITDGTTIKLREKSVFKYYTRVYRKIKHLNRVKFVTQKPSPKVKLYNIYTHLGKNHKGYGNFITYAIRAHKKMSKLPVRSLIRRQIRKHWAKIHKKLD